MACLGSRIVEMSEQVLDVEVGHVTSGESPESLMPSMKGRSVPGRRNPTHLLRDYRFIYRHPDGESGTVSQKMIRELYKKDAWKFMSTLKLLEKEHKDAMRQAKERAAAREAKKESGKEVVDDDGGLDLVEAWLKERKDGREISGKVAE